MQFVWFQIPSLEMFGMYVLLNGNEWKMKTRLLTIGITLFTLYGSKNIKHPQYSLVENLKS